MSAKHSPGPWERDGTIIGGGMVQIDLRLDPDGINWVSVKGDVDETVEANAALIGGAPALLEACRKLYKWGITHGPADDDWKLFGAAGLAAAMAEGGEIS